ncbi:MAG TPA: SagB/ThcOx family dehydrogenase, partial [Planctomycetes bacterium]|nr:SagB/ThcOx family dehydrogenase [Planctomycetota bacterium]
QELGRDASAVIVHTASLDDVDERFGDRGYRYLGLDAGQIGERMNLAAVRLGLGVSGIGGYFDDQVCDVLELPPSEAVVYITVLGQPPQPF